MNLEKRKTKSEQCIAVHSPYAGLRQLCGDVVCDETTKNTENINNERLSILQRTRLDGMFGIKKLINETLIYYYYFFAEHCL